MHSVLNLATKFYVNMKVCKVDFGIGFLTSVSGQTRKVVGNKIVVDSETFYTVFYHLFRANIVVDYVDSVVYVTSL